MNSNRPYLLRALYDWICDNRLTPCLLVDARGDDLNVPRDFVKDNRIVLNISPAAVRELELGNERVRFKGRFSGRSMDAHFPVASVLAIYARENGRGMIFPEEEKQATAADDKPATNTQKAKDRSHLSVIK